MATFNWDNWIYCLLTALNIYLLVDAAINQRKFMILLWILTISINFYNMILAFMEV